jgi:ribosomal protein L30
LGLHKLQHTVIKEDTDQLRGQINKVQHLVSVVELANE